MNIPQPFCFNPQKIKAFVLGCDPTNFSDNGKPFELGFVFGIGQDHRYFSDILANLLQIGIHLENIYIQNLVTGYQDEETGKNKNWDSAAAKCITDRKTEFDKIDPSREIPVFLTAEKLYHLLLNPGEKSFEAADIYALKTKIPIPQENNKLIRPLIPLYRHHHYRLSGWDEYLRNLQLTFNIQHNDAQP